MSRLEEFEYAQIEELIFPCDGYDGHYIRMSWSPDQDGRFLWIENGQQARTLGDRIKKAWSILIKGRLSDSEIVLNSQSVDGIKSFLERKTKS